MVAAHDQDVAAWAAEQAALLRAGKFSELDIEHIADEIEDVGKSEKREVAQRIAMLLTLLLKWTYQPAARGPSAQAVIEMQRKWIGRRLSRMPSLRPMLADLEETEDLWGDARVAASHETGLDILTFPEQCPWELAHALDSTFWPT